MSSIPANADNTTDAGKRTVVSQKRRRPINTISGVSNIMLHLVFILYALACIVPMVIVLSVSLSSELQIAEHGYGVFPRGFNLNAYKFLFTSSNDVLEAYKNSILSTAFGTALAVTLMALYAYPISRPDFRFRNHFTFYLFFTMLFNGGLVPWFMVCRSVLGIYNTLWALFLPASFNQFWVIVMRTFYKTQIPDSLIESARMDGATEWLTWVRIVLPLSTPGLATIALFSTIGIWNNFFLCLILTDPDTYNNLQYTIYTLLNNIQFLRQMIDLVGSAADLQSEIANLPNQTFRMAMVIVTIGPIVLAYPYFQKYFVKGLTIGALKG